MSRSHGKDITTALVKRTALPRLDTVAAKKEFHKTRRARLEAKMMGDDRDEDGGVNFL